jgi:excisionase family DNA binding protein
MPKEYPLFILSDHRHTRIFSPDFKFHLAVPQDNYYVRLALQVEAMHTKIGERLTALEAAGMPLPCPGRRATQDIPPDELLTIQEAAPLLGRSVSTVQRLKDLPCVFTSGGHRRFSRSEVERYRDLKASPPSPAVPVPEPDSKR